MSTNLSDYQPNRDLLRRVAELEKNQRERGTLQKQGSDALNFSCIDPIQQSGVFPANSGGYFGVAPTSSNGAPLFTLLENNYYLDTVSAATEVGSFLNNYRDLWDIDLQVVEHLSSANQHNYRLYVFNHDTISHTFIWQCRVRFLVSKA